MTTERKLYFVIGDRRRWQKFIQKLFTKANAMPEISTTSYRTVDADYRWVLPHSNYDRHRGCHIDGIYVLQDGAEELIHMLTPALLVKDGFIMRIVD